LLIALPVSTGKASTLRSQVSIGLTLLYLQGTHFFPASDAQQQQNNEAGQQTIFRIVSMLFFFFFFLLHDKTQRGKTYGHAHGNDKTKRRPYNFTVAGILVAVVV